MRARSVARKYELWPGVVEMHSHGQASARTPWSPLASCDDQTGVPTRRSTAGWRLEILGVHARAYQQPRDQRVGVPHVAGVQLVSAPHGGWNERHQIEDALGANQVVCDADRTRDGLVGVGDRASAPSTDLVTEQPEVSAHLVPTGPSPTTPRTRPSLSRMGADSMTNRSSETPTSSAVW